MNRNAYLLLDGNNRFDLTKDRITVGSAGENDLVIAVDFIDSYQAELSREGERWYLKDLHSSYGIWLNGMRIPAGEKLPLTNGDKIMLSQGLQMAFTEEAQPESPKVILKKGKLDGKAPNGKKQGTGKKGLVILAGAVVLALLLVLGWCGAMHFIGNSQLEKGEYEAAITSYGRDFLFSSGCAEEAMLRAGDAALAAGDYETAQDYYTRLKERGAEKWSDAIYEQALSAETPEERIEILKQIEDEKRAQEQIGAAQMEMAEALFAEKRYNEAQELAESIQDRTLVDVDAFLNRLWKEQGDNAVLEDYQVEQAISFYQKCEQTETIATQLTILEKLKNGQYFDAAKAMLDAVQEGKTDFAIGNWTRLYEETAPKNPSTTDMYLDIQAGKNLFTGKESLNLDTLKTDIEERIPKGEIASDNPSFPSSHECEDLTGLLASCGSNAAGKILIVGCCKDYPDQKLKYAILEKLMELLPEQYYPRSLSEVEYILLLNYDYGYAGSYTSGTVGLRERGNVQTYQLPKGTKVYATEIQYGSDSPYSFTSVGSPKTKSGGAPDLSSALYKSIYRIVK